MHTIEINGKPITFEGSWTEVNYVRYMAIANARSLPINERISIYTGVDIQAVNSLQLSGIEHLIRLCAWMDTDDVLQAVLEPYSNTDFIFSATIYGDIVEAKQVIGKAGGNVLAAGCDVWRVYFKENISDLPVTKSLSKVHFIANQLGSFLKKYQRLNEFEYSEEQIEAGIERFEGFGAFPTIASLAERLKIKYDDVTKLPVEQVYMTLLHDFEQSEYQKELLKIRERNAKLQQ